MRLEALVRQLFNLQDANADGLRPYKAVVMLFQNGGADSFNMIVPTCNRIYSEYQEMRTDLALDKAKLLAITSVSQHQESCNSFGIHPALEFVHQRYKNTHDAAFFVNIGNLVEPIHDKTHLKGRTVPYRLYSHADQQNGAQTLESQTRGFSPRGGGGRLAEVLQDGTDHQYRTDTFSLAGSSIWPAGIGKRPWIVGGGQIERIGNLAAYNSVLDDVTRTATAMRTPRRSPTRSASRGGPQRCWASCLMAQGVSLETDDVDYNTSFPLMAQFKQVARLIKTRTRRKAERDIFMVEMGGWDHHNNLEENLWHWFDVVNTSFKDFVTELELQGVWDSTAILTVSEFGRTLGSNGDGSDHGWGGHSVLLSGALKGADVINQYHSSLIPGSDHDMGRGRMLPDHPWESMFMPIAEWLGIEEGKKEHAFPNLNAFTGNTTLLKPCREVFRSAQCP